MRTAQSALVRTVPILEVYGMLGDFGFGLVFPVISFLTLRTYNTGGYTAPCCEQFWLLVGFIRVLIWGEIGTRST